METDDGSLIIAIVDDHEMFASLLSDYLERRDDVRATQIFHDAHSFLQARRRLQPSIILLDLDMPGMSPEEVVTETVKAYPDVPVAVISGYADARQARAALDDGARGFIPKTMGLAALSRIIDLILAGETYLPSDFSETHHSSSVDEVDGYALLSPREREVFALLPKGLSNKEIARELGLRDVTVKVHLKHIYQKLDVSNRTEAAVMALRFVGR